MCQTWRIGLTLGVFAAIVSSLYDLKSRPAKERMISSFDLTDGYFRSGRDDQCMCAIFGLPA